MLKLCYFASVREQLGKTDETLMLPAGITTVGELSKLLAERGEAWQMLNDEKSVLIAVNQQVSSRDQRLHGSEEIAFFPPMTGG
ncbi:MAG: molybdopterin converting factor subunit 1 [Pseudohongiella sp.]|nr:molybdopterin converting factor subunit 1 [Pseudohongiella sp.]MDO9519650.1 molybdopterin converting factor subunit 1 [Pseudohongiella sp.]MDP2127655.1 molybdopterin converting factor subunit 1 [Pseudohongiella sp.]